MADTEVSAELIAMREQLQRLEQERARQQTPPPAPPPQQVTSGPESAALETGPEKDWLEELQELQELEPEQVLEKLKDSAGEWLGELNTELKDVKPSTLLLVFGLGVMVGRLTQ